MTRIIPVDDVRYTPAVAVFEDRDDAPISFYVTEFGARRRDAAALPPLPEVFLVERNAALFTAGDEELTVTAGHFVLVPANTPHRYVGASDEPARVVSVHPSGEVVQTNL